MFYMTGYIHTPCSFVLLVCKLSPNTQVILTFLDPVHIVTMVIKHREFYEFIVYL